MAKKNENRATLEANRTKKRPVPSEDGERPHVSHITSSLAPTPACFTSILERFRTSIHVARRPTPPRPHCRGTAAAVKPPMAAILSVRTGGPMYAASRRFKSCDIKKPSLIWGQFVDAPNV